MNTFWLPKQQRSASLKLLEEVFGEVGGVVPVLLLDPSGQRQEPSDQRHPSPEPRIVCSH